MNEKGKYISDGGITFGYGHYVSASEYANDAEERKLVDTYIKNVSILPSQIPAEGVPYKVPNSTYVPIEEMENCTMDSRSQ